MAGDEDPGSEDLGFHFRQERDQVKLLHHGRVATVLRGGKAKKFTQDVEPSMVPDCLFTAEHCQRVQYQVR